MRAHRTKALTLGVSALALTACGGGGSSSSTPPPPPPPPPANVAPSAALAISASVREGDVVVLDASGSSDPDGSPLTYSYAVVDGPALALGGASGAMASVEVPSVDADTSVTLEVTVSDSEATDTAEATFTIENNAPPVVAFVVSGTDPDGRIRETDTLRLDASATTDDEGDALTYVYSVLSGPTDLDLSGLNGPSPEVAMPRVDADMSVTVEVEVSDGRDTVTQTADFTIANNTPPEAVLFFFDVNAGEVSSLREGQPFEIDGTTSTDAERDPLTVTYVQTAGPDLELPDTMFDIEQGGFIDAIAPEVNDDEVVTVEVQVDDGYDVSTARADLTITNTVLSPVFEPDFAKTQTLELTEVEGEITDISDVAYEARAGAVAVEDDNGTVTLWEIQLDDDVLADGGPALDHVFEPGVVLQDSLASPLIALEVNQDSNVSEFEMGLNFIDTSGTTDPTFVFEGRADVGVPTAIADGQSLGNGLGSLFVGGTDRVGLYSYPTGGPSRQRSADSLAGLTLEDTLMGEVEAIDAGFIRLSSSEVVNGALVLDSEFNKKLRLITVADASEDRDISLTLAQRFDDFGDAQDGDFDYVASAGDTNRVSPVRVAMIYSNRLREGKNALVLGGVDDTGNITTQVFTWSVGVPTDVVFTNLSGEGPFTQNVVVLMENEPQAYVIGNLTDPETGSAAVAVELGFMEVGLGAAVGASDIGTPNVSNAGVTGLFLGYPVKGEIRRFDDAQASSGQPVQ